MVHNEPMNVKEWLNTLPGTPTASQAADHAGASKATFLRHEKKGETTAEYAIRIARSYEVNEIQALIDLGIVRESAVMELGIKRALGMAKNSDILAEMDKRVDPEARRLYRAEGHEGVIDVIDEDTGAEVYDFPVSEDESMAASTAPLEPEEGDDDYHGGA